MTRIGLLAGPNGGWRQTATALMSAAVVVVLASCSPAGGGTSSSIESTSPTEPASIKDLSVSSLADVGKMRMALRRAQSAEVAECMADKGFPQLLQAQEQAVQKEAPGYSSATNLDPLDFGPYTTELARKYGMIGANAAVGRAPGAVPPAVISADAAFDEAKKACQEQFATEVGADTRGLIARAGELANSIGDQLRKSVADESRKLISSMVDCVRQNGYPELESNAGSFRKWLRSVGIEPGSWTEPPPKQRPDEGEIVIAPRFDREYTPSPGEVQFAVVYAECAQDIGLVDRVKRMEDAALAEILPKHEAEIVALGTELKAAVRKAAQ